MPVTVDMITVISLRLHLTVRWTIGLMEYNRTILGGLTRYLTNGLGLGVRYSALVRYIIKCNPLHCFQNWFACSLVLIYLKIWHYMLWNHFKIVCSLKCCGLVTGAHNCNIFWTWFWTVTSQSTEHFSWLTNKYISWLKLLQVMTDTCD